MAMFVQSITAPQVLAGLTTDSTKWKGANIGRLDDNDSFGMLDFWSDGQPVTLNTTAQNITIRSVDVPNLTGLTIKIAYAMLKISNIIDTSGTNNAMTPSQWIQVDKAAAGYINAIDMESQCLKVLANALGQSQVVFIGEEDISSRVAFNATTNFRWASAQSAQSNLGFQAVYSGVRVII